jgi:soluble P-type ATPase
MIKTEIPGYRTLQLEHLVLDFNGTLACDGVLLPGTSAALHRLAAKLSFHVVTADTFGKAKEALAGIPCVLAILPPGAQDAAKLRYVNALGAARCVCIGNGRNDHLMLAAAALGIAVIGDEGTAIETLMAADIVSRDIVTALDLLLHPLRLAATLRL